MSNADYQKWLTVRWFRRFPGAKLLQNPRKSSIETPLNFLNPAISTLENSLRTVEIALRVPFQTKKEKKKKGCAEYYHEINWEKGTNKHPRTTDQDIGLFAIWVQTWYFANRRRGTSQWVLEKLASGTQKEFKSLRKVHPDWNYTVMDKGHAEIMQLWHVACNRKAWNYSTWNRPAPRWYQRPDDLDNTNPPLPPPPHLSKPHFVARDFHPCSISQIIPISVVSSVSYTISTLNHCLCCMTSSFHVLSRYFLKFIDCCALFNYNAISWCQLSSQYFLESYRSLIHLQKTSYSSHSSHGNFNGYFRSLRENFVELERAGEGVIGVWPGWSQRFVGSWPVVPRRLEGLRFPGLRPNSIQLRILTQNP